MKMEGIELYPHNQKAYDNLCAMLRDNNRACVVQPTGTGKFVIIAKMAQDNPGKNFLLLGTNDYMYIDQMANLSDIVVCVETGKRYESIKAATREYGDRQESAQSGIGLCCRNPYRTFDGKHWCYPDDLESRIDNAEEYTVPRKTAIRCLETGKMYESIADASRDTGINNNSIRAVARGNRHKAGGYTWEYVNPVPDKHGNRGCNQPSAKKVRCAETGNQFVSLSDAARAVGLRNGNSIRRAIDRGGTAGGYHWEYLDEKKEVSTDDHHQADGRAE